MRKAYLVLTVIVIIVVIIAGIALVQQNDGDDEDTAGGGPGNWRTGDYWQYTQTETGVGLYSGLDQTIYVERYEVVQVNVTNITIAMERDTYSYNHSSGGIDTDHQSANYVFPANWTFWGFEYYEFIKASPSIKAVGSESLDTKWGARMAEHYRDYEDGAEEGPYYHQDWWFVNGIMLQQTSKRTTTGPENEITRTISLQTNFPQLVSS